MKGYKWIAPAIACITLLGLALRFWGYTNYDIWFDEGYHVQLVRLPTVSAMLDAVLSNPPSDPLYALILRGWTGLFGTGDAAIRLPSILFSAATIPVTYLLGRTVSGYRAGLGGALFLAVSPYGLELGQEAALYALASLTTTVALTAAWHWRKTGGSGWLYIISGIVAIYSHYVVAIILLLIMVCLWFATSQPSPVSRKKWLLANIVIFAAWTPWLAGLAIHWIAVRGLPRASLRHPATVSEVVGALTQYSSGTASLLGQFHWLWAVGLLAGIVLALAGWRVSRIQNRRGLEVILLVSALVFILPAMVSAVTGLWLFIPHFMIFLLPSMFVVMASGLYLAVPDRQPAITPNRHLVATLCLGAFGLWMVAQVVGMALFYRYPPHGADQASEMAAYVQANAEKGDSLFMMPALLTPVMQQYYPNRIKGLPDDFSLYNVYPLYNEQELYSRSLDAIEEAANQDGRFWLVYRPETDSSGQLLQSLRSRYRMLNSRTYPFAELYLFGK